MRRPSLISVFALVLAKLAAAQVGLGMDCPAVSVQGPSGLTQNGDSMVFTAEVIRDGRITTSYTWSISAGTIVSGQGTPSITVATTKQMAGSYVTANVRVIGLPSGCTDVAKETAGIAPAVACGLSVDEFGRQGDNEVKARVDNLFIQLQNNPAHQGYIINYGTPTEIKKRRTQLMRAIWFRRYDPHRVTFVDGPNRAIAACRRFFI
jgi:hypothetical protein